MCAFFPNKFSLHVLTCHDLRQLQLCLRDVILVCLQLSSLLAEIEASVTWRNDVLFISAGQKIPGVYARPVTRAQKLENLQLCMSFMGNRNIDLQGIYVGGKCLVHVFFNFLIPWFAIHRMTTHQGSSWHSVENYIVIMVTGIREVKTSSIKNPSKHKCCRKWKIKVKTFISSYLAM